MRPTRIQNLFMTENLLLFSVHGDAFAVREDEVLSVTPAGRLHRLPLSPPGVAGMAIIEERGATIFDLGACIGDLPLEKENGGSYLIVGSEGRKTGFWVEGAVETISHPSGQVLQLPEIVRSDIVETCAVQGSRVIPIIRIGLLQQRISLGELGIPAPGKASGVTAEKAGGSARVRAFFLGKEVFCLDGDGTAILPLRAGLIRRIPYALNNALGVMHYDGELVPVLPAAERLGIDAEGATSVLIAAQGGKKYGLPVTADLGLIEAADYQLLRMPSLVQSGAIHEAAVRGNKIIPVLDLGGIVRAAEEKGKEEHLAGRYTPRSQFKDKFRKETVDLAEVALFGARHAVPQEEMVEVLPVTEIRPVPLAPSIVLGAVVRDAKILPVLDLAAIFGKRSPIDPSWSLLRLTNGDFDVLIAVEKVLGGRTAGVDIQRQVPIVLPFDVVYGCYLDEGSVRLILNVEALTVHYEKTTIRDFMTTMGPAAAAPAEMHAVSPGRKKQELLSEPRVAPVVSEGNEREIPLRSGYAISPTGPSEMPQAAAIPPESDQSKGLVDVETARAIAEREQEAARKLPRREQLDEEADRTALDERENMDKPEKERLEKVRKPIQEEDGCGAEKEELERAQASAAGQKEEERFPEARDGTGAEEQRAVPAAQEPEALRQQQLPKEKTITIAEPPIEKQASESRGSSGGAAERKQPAGPAHTVPREPASPRNGLIAAAIVILLILAFFAGDKGVKPPVRGQPEGHAVVMDKKQETRKQVDAANSETPLVLSIPKAMPLPDPPMYVVVQGDTLWSIAKRFTGNPLNYPRLARDNSIATPDRIFPGQKIRLMSE